MRFAVVLFAASLCVSSQAAVEVPPELRQKLSKIAESDWNKILDVFRSKGAGDAAEAAHKLANLHIDPFEFDIESQAVVKQLNRRDSSGFNLLRTLRLKITGVRLVWPDVKQFAQAIRAGYLNPAYLRLADPELVARMALVPIERRIGFIGAGKNLSLVNELRANAKAQGFEAYFYDDCRLPSGALCPSETVGSFMASVGYIWEVQTAESGASRFVSVEADTFSRLQNGEAMLILLTPQQIMEAAGQTAMLVVKIQINSQQ